ncbi:uncharacterized protein LOC118435957 [Folsomia candida]|uniref:uncharacterized protein LOC118435957 n=1 Tax=Folsomia candida TaxID=158441 RepID=UPI001604FB27|nr:uncharacterized protein LOC118435957 [Folsomia candida]
MPKISRKVGVGSIQKIGPGLDPTAGIRGCSPPPQITHGQNKEKDLLTEMKLSLEFEQPLCTYCLAFFISFLTFISLLANNATYCDQFYDQIFNTPAQFVLLFWTRSEIVRVLRVFFVSFIVLFVLSANLLPAARWWRLSKKRKSRLSANKNCAQEIGGLCQPATKNMSMIPKNTEMVRVNSSPIANLSREVNEAAVTERSRKAEVLKMVEAMTIHEQCKEMSINTCTENIEFEHPFTSFEEGISTELALLPMLALRDLGLFTGLSMGDDDDGFDLVNGTLISTPSNISRINIGYLFDPEDDPVSYFVIYLVFVTLVVFVFAGLTHFYRVVFHFNEKKHTDILRVRKCILSHLFMPALMLRMLIAIFYKSTNYANPAAASCIIFTPLLGIAIGMQRFSRRFINYLLFLIFFRLSTIFTICQTYKFLCVLHL